MNTNLKKLLCILAAILLLAGCRAGGGETTAPSDQTTAPAVTLPRGEGVEEWDDPVETDPVETIPGASTEPGTTEPPVQPTQPQADPTDPPKQPDSTEPPVQGTEPPTQNSEPPTQNTQPPAQSTEPPADTQPQAGGSDPAKLTYEEYLAMSPYEQQAHYESFPSLEAYIAWHNAALAEYEENQSSIEVTGGIDIGDFMNP